MVIVVDDTAQHVTGFEVGEFVGTGTDGFQVSGRITRSAAFEGFKDVLGNDHASSADKRIGPERRCLGIFNFDRMRVNFSDFDVSIRAPCVC